MDIYHEKYISYFKGYNRKLKLDLYNTNKRRATREKFQISVAFIINLDICLN